MVSLWSLKQNPFWPAAPTKHLGSSAGLSRSGATQETSLRQAETCSQDWSNSSWKVLNWDPQATTELKKLLPFSLPKEQQRAPQPWAPQAEEQNHRMAEAQTSGTCVVSLLKAGSPLTGYWDLSHSCLVLGSSKHRETPQVLVSAGEPRTGHSTPLALTSSEYRGWMASLLLLLIPEQPRVLFNCLCHERTSLGHA